MMITNLILRLRQQMFYLGYLKVLIVHGRIFRYLAKIIHNKLHRRKLVVYQMLYL
ncbi:MAG: hypothetical protein BWX55_00143 [Deltaproteobacteria bacterium ADurb.Bin022]|nr:MAG: hypothetical protein BWX55_00143 [Deltaproteobacteria bacterium ADurb.Bin022]